MGGQNTQSIERRGLAVEFAGNVQIASLAVQQEVVVLVAHFKHSSSNIPSGAVGRGPKYSYIVLHFILCTMIVDI